MKYRKEVDGLRAFAILPVIAFHLGMPYISGGYLGVDVFFVISGFLITTIILDEIALNKFSLITFYERRARRILPALMMMLVLTSLAMICLFDLPLVLEDFGKSIISVTLFVSNAYFFMTSGYFGSTSEMSPLLHTWSLAVEEQYYIVFPLLCMFFVPKGRRLFLMVLIAMFLISIVIAEWGWRNSPIGNFYLIPSRFWELLAGSMVSVYFNHSMVNKIRDSYGHIVSNLSLLVIVVCCFTFTSATAHPSLITMLPILATCFVLLFSSRASLSKSLLSTSFLVWVGLISYSLYLWHQPILAISKMKLGLHLEAEVQVIIFFSTVVMSYISWRFIEKPFRNKAHFSQARIFRLSLFALFMSTLVGVLFINNTQIQRLFYPENMQRYSVIKQAHDAHQNQEMAKAQCHFWVSDFSQAFIDRFEMCTKKHSKAVFILGGSHGMDLYNAIAFNTELPFVVSVSKGFCRIHDDIKPSNQIKQCQYEDFKVFAEKYHSQIDMVIYTQTPDRLFKKSMQYAGKQDLSIEHVDQVVGYLQEINQVYDLKVIMLGMLPPLLISPINLDYKRDISQQMKDNISSNIITLTHHVDNVFKEKLAAVGLQYISKYDGFSLNLPQDFFDNNEMTYSDRRHLSRAGERLFGKRLLKFLDENNVLSSTQK